MCVYLVANLCAGRIGLGWAHDAITFAYHMFMHSHAYVISIQYILILFCYLGLFWLSLSPFLSSVCISLLLWHLNANLLCWGTLFVSGHPLLLILHLFLFGSVMRRPNWTSLRTSLDEAFIRNAKSFYWTSSTLTYPLSFTIGVESHYVMSRSLVHLWLSRSFTPTCMDSIIQYLFLLLTFEVRPLWLHWILYLMCSVS